MDYKKKIKKRIPIDYDQVISSPNHNYIDRGVYDRLSPAIFLNCVNESLYWTNPAVLNTPFPLNPIVTVEDVFGTPAGLPRPIRQALSWTFDFHYDDRFEEIVGYILDAANQIGCDIETIYHPNGLWDDMQKGLFPFPFIFINYLIMDNIC